MTMNVMWLLNSCIHASSRCWTRRHASGSSVEVDDKEGVAEADIWVRHSDCTWPTSPSRRRRPRSSANSVLCLTTFQPTCKSFLVAVAHCFFFSVILYTLLQLWVLCGPKHDTGLLCPLKTWCLTLNWNCSVRLYCGWFNAGLFCMNTWKNRLIFNQLHAVIVWLDSA